MHIATLAAVLIHVATAGAAPGGPNEPPTIPIDPVEAAAGREILGNPGISAEHDGYRYLFEDQDNVTRFLMNPGHYAVMWAGACGRMGPLSGKGHPGWYAVHKGRVYIFASEQCRQTFLKDPSLCVEGDEPPPAVTPEGAEKARALLAKAVDAAGGAAKVDALVSFREHRSEMAKDDPAREDTVTLTLVFPDTGHLREAWGPHAYSRFVRGDGGVFIDSNGTQDMIPEQVSAMRRQLAHHPLVILRARERAEFVTTMAEPGEVDGVKVERVVVHFNGATTTLGIDPTNGRVLSAEFRGRGKRALMGEVRRVYSDFRDESGIVTARSWTTTWNGEALGDRVELDSIQIDPPIDPALFGGAAG